MNKEKKRKDTTSQSILIIPVLIFIIFLIIAIKLTIDDKNICEEKIGKPMNARWIDSTHLNCCYYEIKQNAQGVYYETETCKGIEVTR